MPQLDTIGKILEIISKHEIFMISSHINPDGDSISSQLAFYSLLSDFGKKAYILNADPIPSRYNFLPYIDAYQTELDFGDQSNLNDVEVAIILDCGNLNRIGDKVLAKIQPEWTIINIDHHSSNDFFGNYNFVDVNASATAEIIFDFIKESGQRIGYDRAVCLYTGIVMDTGCFKFANTTAKAHRVVAQLIEEGVKPDKITELIYDIIPYRKAKLFSKVLETLKLSHDGKIAYVSITNEIYKQTQTEVADTEGFIDGIEVALLFRETEDDNIKVSLRSKSKLDKQAIDVNQIAKEFDGGGHTEASGCVVSAPLDKAIDMVLQRILKVMV
jgi:phosphoesterase RecJ-like protein